MESTTDAPVGPTALLSVRVPVPPLLLITVPAVGGCSSRAWASVLAMRGDRETRGRLRVLPTSPSSLCACACAWAGGPIRAGTGRIGDAGGERLTNPPCA
jgi:hypothetical protein